MVTHTKEDLIGKGWLEHEAHKTHLLIQKAHNLKSKRILFAEKVLFWFLLAMLVVGNIFISIMLIPIFLSFSTTGVFFVVAVLGLKMGIIMDFVLRDIEALERWHHYFALIVMMTMAILSISLTGIFSSRIYASAGETFFYNHNPWAMGILYSFFLILPYIVMEFWKQKRTINKSVGYRDVNPN